MVVDQLITQVILGVDFLHIHGLVLDFTSMPVKIHRKHQPPTQGVSDNVKMVLDAGMKTKAKFLAIAALDNPNQKDIEECVVPQFGKAEQLFQSAVQSHFNFLLKIVRTLQYQTRCHRKCLPSYSYQYNTSTGTSTSHSSTLQKIDR